MVRLNDTGSSATLDLHGASVAEAEELALKFVEKAAERGRRTVRIIHGSSTTDDDPQNRTIKRALHDLLEEGAFDEWATSVIKRQDTLLISLDLSAESSYQPLTMLDIRR